MILLAGLLFSSCEGVAPVREGREDVRVVIDAFCIQAPVKAPSAEDAVNTLDVLVFREDGTLEAHARAAGQTVTVKVAARIPLEYYVIANAPKGSFDTYADISSFREGLVSLSDNASAFVMRGHGSHVFSGEEENLEVRLDRYVSKVLLDNIVPEFMDTDLAKAGVSLAGVFLVNAVGTTPWSGVPSAGELWYNRMALDGSLDDDIAGMLITPHDIVITTADPLAVNDALYCCPNPTDNGVTSLETPQWCARDTRLVIDLLIGGVHNYYPIDIPAMQGNKCYRVKNATLIGPGSSSPDIPVTRTGIRYTIDVAEWGKEYIDINL